MTGAMLAGAFLVGMGVAFRYGRRSSMLLTVALLGGITLLLLARGMP